MINQISRTPGYVSAQDDCMEKLIKNMASHVKNLKDHLDDFSVGLNEPYKMYFSFSIDLLYLVLDLRIGLLETTDKQSFFIIGQNPVIILNPYLKNKNWIWSTQGLGLKGLVMIMPISPRFSLIMYDALHYTLINKNPKWVIGDADVEKLNDYQYCNSVECIYFATPLNEEQYRKKNDLYKQYRESNKANFEIIGSSLDEKTGYKTEITKTGLREFPIEQKFSFLAYKAFGFEKPINNFNDAKRDHVDYVNLRRRERLSKLKK